MHDMPFFIGETPCPGLWAPKAPRLRTTAREVSPKQNFLRTCHGLPENRLPDSPWWGAPAAPLVSVDLATKPGTPGTLRLLSVVSATSAETPHASAGREPKNWWSLDLGVGTADAPRVSATLYTQKENTTSHVESSRSLTYSL